MRQTQSPALLGPLYPTPSLVPGAGVSPQWAQLTCWVPVTLERVTCVPSVMKQDQD